MTYPAYIFIALSAVIIIFQFGLALGLPLGEYTLGGKFPGKLPPAMRIAALFQIIILLIFTFIVTARAGIGFMEYHNFSRIAIWFVFTFFIPGTILNVSSPSKKERIVMGPANIIALITVLITALS